MVIRDIEIINSQVKINSNRPLTFYFASRYSRREELCEYRSELESRGMRVPARWLNGNHNVEELDHEKAALFASEDVEDVLESDVLVAFTEEPRATLTRGGRHVEMGIAMGLRLSQEGHRDLGVPVVVVIGPLENVFMRHDIVEDHFETFEEFLRAFDSGEWSGSWLL